MKFLPGNQHALGAGGRLSLDTSLVLAPTDREAQLELIPRIVSNDLRALGISQEDEGFFASVETLGMRLFGGTREAKTEVKKRVVVLEERRLDAIEARLREKASFPPEQVVCIEWDGRVSEGFARVDLRVAR